MPSGENAPEENGQSARVDALHDELHRRIEELRTHHEHEFGTFHALDWILIVLGCLLLPIACYLWFLP